MRVVTHIFDTFNIASANPTAPPARFPANIGLIGVWGVHMLGIGGGDFGTGGAPGPLQAIHVLGVVAVVVGVIAAGLGLTRGMRHGHAASVDPTESWRLDDLLVIAFVADLAVFVLFTTTSTDQTFSRYLTGAVAFGAILAGRAVGGVVHTLRSSWIRRGGALLGVAVLVAFGAGTAFTVTAPAPGRPYEQLGAFLQAHHLDRGIGDCWSASVTTVATGQSVTVRPVIADATDRIVSYERQSSTLWYTGQSFQFLVYDTAHLWGNVNLVSASKTFGPTTRTYVVGTYRVLVWNHPVSVPDPTA